MKTTKDTENTKTIEEKSGEAGFSEAVGSIPAKHEKSRNEIKTTKDLLKHIPQSWRNAEICIGADWDEPRPVVRVSLQRNRSGRKVVMIHERDFRG